MEIEDNILVNEALEGSQSAFARLLGMYWGDVYSFLASKNICAEDAEDLCIETFSKCFEKLSMYDPAYKFKTWLLNIAKNNYIDFMRKNAPLASLFSEKIYNDSEYEIDRAGEETPETRMIERQSLEHFKRAVEYLHPRYREVMRLRYMEDMSVSEISERMGISLSNVKVMLMRGRKMLLKDME